MTKNELYEKLKDVYLKKNADYGDSFTKSLRTFGVIASLVRVSDKLSRLETLMSRPIQEVKDESINDTIEDAINYIAMTIGDHDWVHDIGSPLSPQEYVKTALDAMINYESSYSKDDCNMFFSSCITMWNTYGTRPSKSICDQIIYDLSKCGEYLVKLRLSREE